MYKKKWITGFAGAAVIAAAFGFAASMTNNVPGLGASSDEVSSCQGATALETSWTSTYSATANGGNGGYIVDTVTVANIEEACQDSAELKVTLSETDGTALGVEESDPVADTEVSKDLDFSAQDLAAEDVEQVHVLLVE